MTKPIRPVILIADDDEKIVYAFRQTFKDGATVISAADGEEALGHLTSRQPALAFIDITMPKKDGLTVLKEAGAAGIQTPIIVITGYGTMNTAIDAMKLGAFDYITKPLDINHLRTVASHAMEVVRLKDEVQHLKSELAKPTQADEIIGSHPTMQEVFKQIGLVAPTPNTTNVLITGESGTGKELVAKAIHRSGTHNSDPFLAINCTVLPENLLESELFGHERGAFTGAVKTKQGKFEVAGSGTILLDEIGDMPMDLQRELLRVLEEREFTPIGGHRRVPVLARFITSTNHDLTDLMRRGKFREDLFYRLNVYRIHLPPLRERKDDIPGLVDFFVTLHSKALNKQVKAIADDALQVLIAYDFPGNVRELQNVLVSAVTQEQGEVLMLRSLPRYLFKTDAKLAYPVSINSLRLNEARQHVVRAFEEQFVRHLLKLTGGNVTRAAEKAGIERQSFQRIMSRHGVRSQDFRTIG